MQKRVPTCGAGDWLEYGLVIDAAKDEVTRICYGIQSRRGNRVHNDYLVLCRQAALVIVLKEVIEDDTRVIAFTVREERQPWHHVGCDLLGAPVGAIVDISSQALADRVDIVPVCGHIEVELRLLVPIRHVVWKSDACLTREFIGDYSCPCEVCAPALPVSIIVDDVHRVPQISQVRLED